MEKVLEVKFFVFDLISLHIWLRRDNFLLEVRGEYLNTDMLTSCEEESCSDGSIQKDIFFLFCEFEYVLKDIYRGWGLLE
jgi:hypothetical protein